MSEPVIAPREVWVVYNADGPDYVASYPEAAREHVLELLDCDAGRALAPWHVAHYVIAARTEGGAMTPDERILWGVVANARRGPDAHPLWACVLESTGMSSTASAALCRRFGFAPDSTSRHTDRIAARNDGGNTDGQA